MASNDFRVKNGLVINTDLIYATAGSGRIGINNTSPTANLHLTGTANVSGLVEFNLVDGGYGFESNSEIIVSEKVLKLENIQTVTPMVRATQQITKFNSTGGTISGDVSITTKLTLNTSSVLTSTAYTTSSTSQVAIDTFATTSYRATKYLAQMTSGSSYHMIELNLIHDGTTVWLAQYGEVFTGSSLGTFDANILTGNVQLLFTPTNSATTVKLMRTNIVV